MSSTDTNKFLFKIGVVIVVLATAIAIGSFILNFLISTFSIGSDSPVVEWQNFLEPIGLAGLFLAFILGNILIYIRNTQDI